ncbi:cohesin complex subunit psm1 [Jimgerdemannia flammicorona]|uniref:Structural maintenance of chromosomes protein n=1 Tax=Jimgerdemannia flammicorona TaxID=994334 RepID=A0A433D911_9FUNG|nr:cohesin complex subunit psm1 [Jimgerdemannia flammicorona]
MGRLVRLDIENFKSYKGHQVIGPFHKFTCIIGPNGAGKSNLMDAISFVLGIKSTHLRSAQLKDLIYRGRAMQEDPDNPTSPTHASQSTGQNPRKAYVTAVYEDDKRHEIRFTRTITASGTSEYRINDKTVQYVRYNAALEKENILVKARNFLVFQGDVEAIASQSPKDLTKLIEQISGSLELKADYENLKVQQERATENSTFNFNKKRGITAEIKQYQEQKAEAEKFEHMQERRRGFVVRYLLWKLFHVERKAGELQEEIEERRVTFAKEHEGQAAAEDELKEARKQHARVHKDNLKIEKQIKSTEKDLDDKRPALVNIEEKIAHLTRKIKQSQENLARVQRDHDHQRTSVTDLEAELAKVNKAAEQYEASLGGNANKKGPTLGDNELTEYNKKKEEVNIKTVNEKQQVSNLRRKHKTDAESAARMKERLDDLGNRQKRLQEEEASLIEHKEKVNTYVTSLVQELEKSKKELETMVADRKRVQYVVNLFLFARGCHGWEFVEYTFVTQKEQELNEKLQDTLNKLMQARVDQRESEREQKMKENLDSLKRIFPGVHGRIIDLCTPTQRKYDSAIAIILGRNMDAVVVDKEQTAKECIQYMREQRAGHATFIPLDKILVKPTNTKYRGFIKGARLAIDVIQFEDFLERALQYACGNALVCDSLQIAKHICYEKNQEVKAVTLDGTVIHKNGLITGGQSGLTQGARRWEEKEVEGTYLVPLTITIFRLTHFHFRSRFLEGLSRTRDNLLGELNELSRQKRRGTSEELLKSECAGFEGRLTYSKEDLMTTKRKLDDIKDELKHIGKDIAQATPKYQKVFSDEFSATRNFSSGMVLKSSNLFIRSQASADLASLESDINKLEAKINATEDSIFRDFCLRIRVSNIREYEERQLRLAQETAEMRLKFATQQSRVQNQLTFETQQLQETSDRVARLYAAIRADTDTLERLEVEKERHLEETKTIMDEIAKMEGDLKRAREIEEQKMEFVNRHRKEVAKRTREVDKLMKEVVTRETEVERLNAEKVGIFRKCKLEEIAVPLAKGSLNDVPMDDTEVSVTIEDIEPKRNRHPPTIAQRNEDMMEVDEDGPSFTQSQRSIRSSDWRIEVDYSELDDDKKSDDSVEVEQKLQNEIKIITSEIERMAPNLKAVDRLDGVESRLRETEEEFDTARREAKTAKDKFTAIKQKRYKLFYDAYSHISEKIDQIYKDLTKSRAVPSGGTAYLSLEDSEEPYLDGIKYHAMPPMKRFRDMEQLSGGEKTMAALALLFAIHSYQPSPFFVLDEVDAALDNTNVGKIANYIREHADENFQFVVISLKSTLYEKAEALVGIYRDQDVNSSRTLTVKVGCTTGVQLVCVVVSLQNLIIFLRLCVMRSWMTLTSKEISGRASMRMSNILDKTTGLVIV